MWLVHMPSLFYLKYAEFFAGVFVWLLYNKILFSDHNQPNEALCCWSDLLEHLEKLSLSYAHLHKMN